MENLDFGFMIEQQSKKATRQRHEAFEDAMESFDSPYQVSNIIQI